MSEPTPEEMAAQRAAHRVRMEAEAAAQVAMSDRLRAARAGNRDHLALASPTAADTRKQVDRLTRQVNALIRLTLADLDDISGTEPPGATP